MKITIKSLGFAGVQLCYGEHNILFNPCLTRVSLIRRVLSRYFGWAIKIQPNEKALRAFVSKQHRCFSHVFVGHTHVDDALDGIVLTQINDVATIVGSSGLARFARAAGINENRIQDLDRALGYSFVMTDGVSVQYARINHGHVVDGNPAPYGGQVPDQPIWPAPMRSFQHGNVYSYRLNIGGTKILFLDTMTCPSFHYCDEPEVDVLILALPGWQYGHKPGSTESIKIIETFQPKVVIPTAWDQPWLQSEHPRLMHNIELQRFGEVMKERFGVETRKLTIGHTYNLTSILADLSTSA